MLANILQLLTKAIKKRHCIAIRYHGQRQVRVVEPHAIFTNEHGDLILDGYQTRGHSSSGRPTPFWRPFRVKKIKAISVLKESFKPRVAEGFSSDRLKYRNRLLAIVETKSEPALVYPPQTAEMGPFLPEGMRRG